MRLYVMDDPTPFSPLLPRKEPNWPPVYNSAELDALPLEKPRPLVENLLDCGSLFLFAGGSKTFKTWMQCELAICLADGLDWLGFHCCRSNVLYVNMELKNFYVRNRLAKIRQARGIPKPQPNLIVWNLRRFKFGIEFFSEKLLEICKHHDSQIVFIDPYYKVLSVADDENSQTSMAHILGCFDPLIDADITVCFGIHFSKGNQAAKEPEDRISGAGAIVRDADGVITLTRHEEPLAFTLDFLVRDFPPLAPFVVRWVSPLMDRTQLDPDKLKKPLGRSISYTLQPIVDLIQENDDQLSTQELQELCVKELGLVRSTFYRKLAQIKNQKLARLSPLTNKWNLP